MGFSIVGIFASVISFFTKWTWSFAAKLLAAVGVLAAIVSAAAWILVQMGSVVGQIVFPPYVSWAMAVFLPEDFKQQIILIAGAKGVEWSTGFIKYISERTIN